MVREWLQWVAGRPSTRRRRMAAAAAANGETSNSSGGCMCAVFQLFDLHHMHPFGHPTHFLQQEAAISSPKKGVEAPRNSLELEETLSMKVASSMPLPIKQKQDNSNFLVGINKIKTRVDPKSRTEDNNYYSSDCSPGTTKTPNLVARLMGLDLLPDSSNNSPSLSTSISNPRTKNKSNNNRFSNDDIAVGARSSSSARRSDFEYHRLSLQINKENKNGDDFAISSKTRGKSAKSENSSPAGHFAKQVVNQVKERVNRRGSGLTDITNTNYKDEFCRRDQNLVLNQPIKKLDPKKKIVASSGTKSPRNSTSSCEGNNYEKKTGGGNGNCNTSSGVNKLQSGPQGCDYSVRAQKLARDKKAKSSDKKLGPSISGDIVNMSGPTTILPVKKDPSPRATKLPQKQSQVSDALSSKRSTQLSRNPSRSYKQLALHPDQISTVLPVPDNDNGRTTTAAAAAYKDYVGKILKRAGINEKLTLGKWRTDTHPLDPSIFYYLELFYPGAAVIGGVMNRRSNRKLVFQLVDELLAEVLKTHLDLKTGVDRLGLCDELCEKIGNFPAADCRVLEDIDLLIDGDLGKSRLNGGFEEEGEGLVCEIESEIMEWLVNETVSAVVGGGVTEEEVKRKKKKKKTEIRQVPRVGEVCHVRRCQN